MSADRFGNAIDPSVGYARGTVLRSSTDEVRRLRRAQALAGRIVEERGPDSLGIFTGNPRYFPVAPEDLSTLCEEWVGPGLFARDLAAAAIAHMGGSGTEAVAVANRTSAGIVAAILALCDDRPVVSVVPEGDRSHASVVRGCRLAKVALAEVEARHPVGPAIAEHQPKLVVVTTVTSTLARLDDEDSRAAIAAAKAGGATVLLDEAYGARLRPVLHGGAPSLALGADLAITNTDKAGLMGPRAGVLVGDPAAVVAVLAKASELGMEARAPIAAGALRSLQAFDPETLREEARDGRQIADALVGRFGEAVVARSDLGPMLDEQDVLALLLARSAAARTAIVPAEATAAAGMVLLRERGVLTTNTHGQPGGRVSLRFKPTAGALARLGGAESLAAGLDAALDEVAGRLDDPAWFRDLLFGEGAAP